MELDGERFAVDMAVVFDAADRDALVAIRRLCDETMLRKRSTQAWADALAEVARIVHERLDP